MPIPINTNKDRLGQNYQKVESQDLSSLIPLLQNPFGLLSQVIHGDDEKKALKEIWLKSKFNGNKSMTISSSIDRNKVKDLNSRGLIEIDSENPDVVKFTREGTKLLNQAILSDEKCAVSFVKKASKDLISKNSYDFGDEVLVKINHPERYGFRYAAINKKQFKQKNKYTIIDDYNIETKDKNGVYKNLDSYSDIELIKVLHLSKRIIDNHHKIRVAGKKIIHVPIHRIKKFAEEILQELNSR